MLPVYISYPYFIVFFNFEMDIWTVNSFEWHIAQYCCLYRKCQPKKKSGKKSPGIKEALDDTGAAYEEVKKDLSALSEEEQMDVLYR